MSNIADGAVVTFLCRGFYEGNRFLNGLTDAPVFGGVDLEIIPGLQSLNICAGGYATSRPVKSRMANSRITSDVVRG
jgi:hypothetical protein